MAFTVQGGVLSDGLFRQGENVVTPLKDTCPSSSLSSPIKWPLQGGGLSDGLSKQGENVVAIKRLPTYYITLPSIPV